MKNIRSAAWALLAWTVWSLPLLAVEFGRLTDFPAVPDDKNLAIERIRVQMMTHKEHPLARAERIAHDYVYAGSDLGYKDPRLLRRMKADGLTVVETFEHNDGTAAMVVRDDRTGKHIVAFRGSDDEMDHKRNAVEVAMANRPVGTVTYSEHKNVWDDWAAKYGATGPLTVTGHSRGGGLAALFTANHSGKVGQLVMFQAPGQNLEEHQLFRKNGVKWPETTLVVAATDGVQLPGARHVGEPNVIVGWANDMDSEKVFGHTSYLLQNRFMMKWDETPYRNPEDGLKRVELDHYEYARLRVGAVVDVDKFKVELDMWSLLSPGETVYRIARKFVLVGGELLAEATVSSEILLQIINEANRPAELRELQRRLKCPGEDLFDHVLPEGLHSLEPDFYRVFKKLIEKDLAEVESGKRPRPSMRINGNAMAYIATNSVEDYLAALKEAYGDSYVEALENSIADLAARTTANSSNEPLPKPLLGRDQSTQYQMRIRLLQKYYELQRQALVTLDEMFAAEAELAIAKVAEEAGRLSECVKEVENYLLDAARRAAVTKQAANPPRPKGSGHKAQKQAAEHVQRVADTNGQAPPDWTFLTRAYEEIHEDLFAGASTFAQYTPQVTAWRNLSKSYWDNLTFLAGRDQKAKDQLAAQKKLYLREIEAIDLSFTTQARDKLAKLELLYGRYQRAGIMPLLNEVEQIIAVTKAGINDLVQATPDWFKMENKMVSGGTYRPTPAATIRTERDLANLAPNGVMAAMTWFPGVVQRSRAASEAAMKLQLGVSDWMQANQAKIAREQDYVLSLLDIYILESARRADIQAYYAEKAGVRYPDGMALRTAICDKGISPLSEALVELADLQDLLGADFVGVPIGLGELADKRALEIAYFGESFEALRKQEMVLMQDYLAVQPRLRQGSSRIAATVRANAAPDIRDCVWPQLTFNGKSIYVAHSGCDDYIRREVHGLTTDKYRNDIGEQWRIWNLPPGDTRDANPNKRLGPLLAFMDEHAAFERQFPGALEEIENRARLVAPLHERYTALAAWRKQLESSFRLACGKPLLQKAYQSSVGPAAYQRTDEYEQAMVALNFDHSHHASQLAYMRDIFIPRARKLIADMMAEEQRIRKEVETRLAKATEIAQEIEASPGLPMPDRARKLDKANKLINYCLAMHHSVDSHAPFKSDFATQTMQVNQQLGQTGGKEPPAPSGLLRGRITDRQTGAPLPGVTVRLVKAERVTRSTITMVSDDDGRFSTDHIPPGAWDYSITRAGYQPFEGALSVRAGVSEELVAPLVRATSATTGTLAVNVLRGRRAESVAVTITITDLKGRKVAEGAGPHPLAPGEYIVNTFARYMERDPASAHVRLGSGQKEVVDVRVWQDEGEDDDKPGLAMPPAPAPVPGPAAETFDRAVVLPCAPDRDFVRSLYHCITHREPTAEALDAQVERLRCGITRQLMVTYFFASPGYVNEKHDGVRFMTDACQAIYARQPTAAELRAWPRTDRKTIINEMFKNPAHLAATRECAAKWRKAPAAARPDAARDDAPTQDTTKSPAYEKYMEAHNALARLMAAGKGGTPEGQEAYKKLMQAKEAYEKSLKGSTPGSTR